MIDAWDDLQDDIKKNRYNPLNERFAGNAAGEKDYIETTLTHSLRLIYSAFHLLEFGSWQVIIENILFCGLPGVQKAVLDGRWNEVRKAKEKQAHERSV